MNNYDDWLHVFLIHIAMYCFILLYIDMEKLSDVVKHLIAGGASKQDIFVYGHAAAHMAAAQLQQVRSREPFLAITAADVPASPAASSASTAAPPPLSLPQSFPGLLYADAVIFMNAVSSAVGSGGITSVLNALWTLTAASSEIERVASSMTCCCYPDQ